MMASSQALDGDLPAGNEFISTSGLDMDSSDKTDDDFHLIRTPRSGFNASFSSEVFSTVSPRPQHGKRPQSARIISPKPAPSSNIPVKISGPIKIPSQVTSRTSSASASRTSTVSNKHTLEIQFINKNKRYVQMRKELLEKQKPVLDLYHSLAEIKKKLEDMGKSVKLEDIKLVPFNEYRKKQNMEGDAGECVPQEVYKEMKGSIEEIPKNLMDICKNLLSRRALIVDLLESVTRAEVDIPEVSERIGSLKKEGLQLQHSLDAVLAEHQVKVDKLVLNWQKLLKAQQAKPLELQYSLEQQEKLTHESNKVIRDLQKKLEDRKYSYDKSVNELNGVISTLKEQIKKLEHDIEAERKTATEIRNRNATNANGLKAMRSKIQELENEKKNTDSANAELHRRLRHLQDQIRNKEAQWTKEKEELGATVKRQNSIMQKLNVDKTRFETAIGEMEEKKLSNEEDLQNEIATLNKQLLSTKADLEQTTSERNEAVEKCAAIEGYIARMGLECKETMNKVSCSIEWGKAPRHENTEAENYMEDIAKDLKIRELEDTLRKMENERLYHIEERMLLEQKKSSEPSDTEKQLTKQQECIGKYQMLLEDSENKLREKSAEVANLRSEIRQLKVRQEALEEQNYNCPTDELQRMVEEGRHKLSELMKKSIESEQKLEHYANIIEKQTQQMSEMENLLRYRENMAGVLKASRDELVLEKESLTRYSHEMRTVLAEVTKEGKMKDRLIKELQEKIDLRERQINKLEKEVRELETNLMITNEKRFKLQETIGTMEKELQSTKAHVNQLADINSRSMRPKFIKPF